MSYLRRTNIIEGIGDELLYAGAAFVGILVPMVAFVLKRQVRSQAIHPDSAANVQTAREHIQQEHHGRPQRPNPRHTNDGQLSCPICLGEAAYAIETNCGHLFCGHCIVTYWRHGTWLGAVRCPVCRQQVTLLLQNFTEAEVGRNSEDQQRIINEINLYNRRFSGEPRPLMDTLRDLPTLLRHAVHEFFSVGGLIWMFRFRVIVCFLAALLYFISPLDIIPEAVFGILGFLDDLFILLLLAIYISIMYRQFVQSRAEAGGGTGQVAQ